MKPCFLLTMPYIQVTKESKFDDFILVSFCVDCHHRAQQEAWYTRWTSWRSKRAGQKSRFNSTVIWSKFQNEALTNLMSPSVSWALKFASNSKKQYGIMNSTIKTKYKVDTHCMSAKYTFPVTHNVVVLIWVIARVKTARSELYCCS